MRRLLAVLGSDVRRSLSPALHGAAAARCGFDIAYIPVSCPDVASFERAIQALRTLGALGGNVTIPYKSAAMRLADEVTATAHAIGVVNTLTFDGAVLRGDNTDGPALVDVLEGQPLDRVQILGAGGAARAAAWALAELGASEVVVCARASEAAAEVAALAGGRPSSLSVVAGATLVISALPGNDALAHSAVGSWIDQAARPTVYDLAYGPRGGGSPLVIRARSAGLDACDGLEMLIAQAARSLAGWTGGEVSLIRQAMRDVYSSHLLPDFDT